VTFISVSTNLTFFPFNPLRTTSSARPLLPVRRWRARRAAAMDNFQPSFAIADSGRTTRELTNTFVPSIMAARPGSAFVPQPKAIDISRTPMGETKALETANRSTAIES
jgi:hypothetical protein